MASVKYEQLSSKTDFEEDVITTKPKRKWSETCFQKGLLSLGLILLYFSLSIGLTFYQRWLLTVRVTLFKSFTLPDSSSTVYMLVAFL